MQKLRIMTSNCISQHSPLGASSRQKNLRFEASADQRLGTGAFKVVREYNGYCVQCTLPIIFTIFQNFQRSVEPCHWQVTTQFIKFEPVPIYLELSFILFAKFLLFLMAILEAKIFKIQNFFLHLLKCMNNKHTLFELVSS